jgi:hypothetical protein
MFILLCKLETGNEINLPLCLTFAELSLSSGGQSLLLFVFAEETVTKEKPKRCQRNVIKVRTDDTVG